MLRHLSLGQDRCRAAIRTALIALGMAAGVACGSASAYSFVWDSDIAAYNAFAAQCANAGGPGCPGAPMHNSTILFGWGSAAFSHPNSWTTWTNTGPTFVLDTISVTALGTGIGSGAQSVLQGTGAAPTWEWNDNAASATFGDAQMRITVGSNPAQDLALFSELPSGDTWYESGNTRQTPINATFSGGAGLTVHTGDSIEFRLFEAVWPGASQNQPDLVYAPMTIDILAAVPEPDTSGLMVLGLAGLGWAAARRRKT